MMKKIGWLMILAILSGWGSLRGAERDAESLPQSLERAGLWGRALFRSLTENRTPREVLEEEGPGLRKRYLAAPPDERAGLVSFFSELSRALGETFPEPQRVVEDENAAFYTRGGRLLMEDTSDEPDIELLLLEGYAIQLMAVTTLETLYFHGLGTQEGMERIPRFYEPIRAFWEQFAEEGMPRGLWVMGKAYLQGLGVERDVEKGLKYLEASGLEEAWMAMAMHYHLAGKSVQARAWWRYAALETNNPEAWYSLGVEAIASGDYREARDALENALKLDPKFHEAKIELSRLYIEGWGVKPDYDKAEGHLREVLATGREHIALHAYADVNLGNIAFRRGQPDAARNRARFSELRRKTADRDPAVLREFALMMLGSFAGIEPNPDVAVTWLKRAAEAGDAEAAMLLVREFNFSGAGFGDASRPIDVLFLLRKAVDQGDAAAQFELGLLYFDGEFVEPDPEKGQAFYRLSAEQGYPRAMMYLGMRLWEGKGMPRDLEEAGKWIRRAAETGEQNAAMLLTLFLSEFETGENKPFEVYVWSTLAIREGVFDLHRLRDQMALQLSEDEWVAAKTEVERRFTSFHTEGFTP